MLNRQSLRFSSTIPSDLAFWSAAQNFGILVPSGNSQQVPTIRTTVFICPGGSLGLMAHGLSLLNGLRPGGKRCAGQGGLNAAK